MTIRNIITKSIISINTTLTINETAKIMKDTKIKTIIIMEDNTPVGIITDKNFTIKITAHTYQITTPIKQIMSSPLFSINSDETIRITTDLMHNKKIRKLPIINNRNIIEIITSTDIINLLTIYIEKNMRDIYFHSITKIYTNYNPYN